MWGTTFIRHQWRSPRSDCVTTSKNRTVNGAAERNVYWPFIHSVLRLFVGDWPGMNRAIPWHDASLSHRLPTFRHSVVPTRHSSRVSRLFKMKTQCSLETSRTDYPVTQRSTPEERSPQEGTYRRLGITCCFHLQATRLKIETAATSVIFVRLHQTTRRHVIEDFDHICRCENLKNFTSGLFYFLCFMKSSNSQDS